jgi:diguanylate cyclase (GGDEF)-like protein
MPRSNAKTPPEAFSITQVVPVGAFLDESPEDTAVTERLSDFGGEALARDRARVVVVVGDRIGSTIALRDGAVIGRAADAAVHVFGEHVSRRHARFRTRDGQFLLEDLGSKNGTLLNGVLITEPTPLHDGDKIQIGSSVLRFALLDAVDESFLAQLHDSALRDPLTRVFNRKYLDDRLKSELAYSLRHRSPLSLLLIDVDFFKRVNDTHGHPSGDAVLAQLAERLRRAVRAEDVLARYGGEEFAILSRGIDRAGAAQFAERVRASIEQAEFACVRAERLRSENPGETIPAAPPEAGSTAPIRLTVSVGVATVPDPEILTVAQLVQCADDAAYRAKHTGRNRVRVHGES